MHSSALIPTIIVLKTWIKISKIIKSRIHHERKSRLTKFTWAINLASKISVISWTKLKIWNITTITFESNSINVKIGLETVTKEFERKFNRYNRKIVKDKILGNNET